MKSLAQKFATRFYKHAPYVLFYSGTEGRSGRGLVEPGHTFTRVSKATHVHARHFARLMGE